MPITQSDRDLAPMTAFYMHLKYYILVRRRSQNVTTLSTLLPRLPAYLAHLLYERTSRSMLRETDESGFPCNQLSRSRKLRSSHLKTRGTRYSTMHSNVTEAAGSFEVEGWEWAATHRPAQRLKQSSTCEAAKKTLFLRRPLPDGDPPFPGYHTSTGDHFCAYRQHSAL
jgi:hypothetical protein